MAKRYFWLKLKKDFFKRHDIRIVEEMDNGKEYILFYLKLIAESVDHAGHLRFSDTIPYDEKMLSTITNTNIDIVRSACKIFSSLNLMECLDDGTLFLTESSKMIGSEESSTERVKKYREKQKLLSGNGMKRDETECNMLHVTKCNTYIDKDIDLDLKTKKEKEVKHRHGEYSHVLLTDKQFKDLTEKFGSVLLTSAIKILDEGIEEKGYKYKNHNLTIQKWPIKEARLAHQKKNGDPWE